VTVQYCIVYCIRTCPRPTLTEKLTMNTTTMHAQTRKPVPGQSQICLIICQHKTTNEYAHRWSTLQQKCLEHLQIASNSAGDVTDVMMGCRPLSMERSWSIQTFVRVTSEIITLGLRDKYTFSQHARYGKLLEHANTSVQPESD
jgi:ribosomal protein S17